MFFPTHSTFGRRNMNLYVNFKEIKKLKGTKNTEVALLATFHNLNWEKPLTSY